MFDLWADALTPGHPEVMIAAYVSASAAGKLAERLMGHELVGDVRIVPHADGVTVDNVNDRNTGHLEVLMAVLERREAQAATDAVGTVV